MTVFSELWDASFEAIPPDNEGIKIGASRIRALKRDIRERVAVDHSWAGDANDGKHLRATLRALASDPTLDATDGALYTKVVSGITEVFYKDSAGHVTQLTNNGMLNTPALPPTLPQLIAVVGATASPNIDFTNLLSASFTSFELRFSQLMPATDGSNANLLFGVGSTPTWQVAGYNWVSQNLGTDGTSVVASASNDAHIPLSRSSVGIPGGVSAGLTGTVTLFNAAVSTFQSMLWEATQQFELAKGFTGAYGIAGSGSLGITTPITSLRIQAQYGITGDWATGRVELWGYP